MMQIVSKQGDPSIAQVYVAKFRGRDDLLAEFVDARDPELPISKKWVIIISTQFGCPISCPMCDAGGNYLGDLTANEMLSQIDYVISTRPELKLKLIYKFKIQFARMGEPALNPEVLKVLRVLPSHYPTRGLIPCIATTAPAEAKRWFEELIFVRRETYAGHDFQLQLSVNSTDEDARNKLMPAPKMTLPELGKFASRFYIAGQRKVSINFALTKGVSIDADVIAKYFDPKCTCVKLTPLNPTNKSIESGFETALPPDAPQSADLLCTKLRSLDFDVILSIGDTRENQIGSNCGMAVKNIRSEAN